MEKDYNAIYERYKTQVDKLIRSEPSSGFSGLTGISIPPQTIYIIIPVVIIVFLFWWRPGVVMVSTVDEDDKTTTTLSWRKVFIYGIIIGGLLNLGWLWRTRRKKL